MSSKLTINEISLRLCAFIKWRIDSGEFTERSLARVLQVSQPHLHNMLKGARRLNAKFADHVMKKFDISVLDLFFDEEIWQYLDEKNPKWLTQAAKRKAPAKAQQREHDLRAAWRSKGSGA